MQNFASLNDFAATLAAKLKNGAWVALPENVFAKMRVALSSAPKSVRLSGQDRVVLVGAGGCNLTIADYGDAARIISETDSRGTCNVGSCMSASRAAKTARDWLAMQQEAPALVAQIDAPAAEVVAEPKPKKTRAKKAQAPAAQPTRQQRAEKIAATLPDDEAGLMKAARAAVLAFHTAVMGGNDEALEGARDAYDAVIYKLNGNTSFASYGDDNAPGYRVERHCAAEAGAVPMWGQAGRFVVDMGAFSVDVEYRGLASIGSRMVETFVFRAVDLDKPFISETGYQSHHYALQAGRSVGEVARLILAQLVKDRGTVKIEDDYRKVRRPAVTEAPQTDTKAREKFVQRFPLLAPLFDAAPAARKRPARAALPDVPAPRFEQLTLIAALDAALPEAAAPKRAPLHGMTVAAACRQISIATGRPVMAEDMRQPPFDVIDLEQIPAFLLRHGSPLGQGTHA